VPSSGERRVRRSCWSLASSRASSAWPRWAAVAASIDCRSPCAWASAAAAASPAAWSAWRASSATRTWALSIRARSRARWSRGTSGRAERRAAITAALVAVTCDWTCWKAESAAPVGRVGATPPSEEAASTADWAWRTC
jgi:hypothetical protein